MFKRDLESYLGKPTFLQEELLQNRPGIVTGLAWTNMGGATLQIEATAIVSKRKGFKQTGQLGNIMVESSEIAYSYVMAHLKKFGAKSDFFDEHFVHLHVPARRASLSRLIFPHGNRKDVAELPEYLREGLEFFYAKDFSEVRKWAFDS